MPAYNSKDQLMLQEAYTGILFEHVLPTLTLEDVQNRLQYMTESELEHTEEVIEELFGGLKALGGAVGGSLKRAGSAAWDKAKGAYDKVDKFGNNVGKAVDGAVSRGAGQLGRNVSNIYRTGEDESNAKKRLTRADNAIGDLIQALEELQDANPDIAANLGDNFMKLPLSQIRNALKRGHKSKAGTAGKMRKRGFTGGVGDSIKQGWQSGFQG
jgi:hypothetical protein